VLWAHNDSGDRPRVFALRQDGTALGDVDITGAEAVDWEDMAVGPGGGPSPGDALYLADIGDNESVRSTIDVYRVSEPQVTASGPVEVAPAVRLRLRYPDGPHDAETLLVHPRSGELLIVTKHLSGESEVYAARRPAAGATTTLRRVGRLHLGLGGMATGGSVSADGRVVVVRTYGGLVAWGRRPGASLAATLRRAPCRGQTDLGGEGPGEAIALSRGGGAFFTVPEGSPAAIRRAAPRVR
jgi:hypothetical protein